MHHKAEPEEGLIFHSEECGAVSEHQSFFVGIDKYIIRGHALFENFHQNEICIRFVNFHGFPGQQLLIDSFTLGGDQVSGAADIVPVIEHIGACQFSQTVDGPGIRYVIFFKGCPLRCKYCHNPDTWSQDGAEEWEAQDIVNQAMKYKGYWGDKGGVTITGGEPLLQLDFAIELLRLFHEQGVRTAVDTSGYIFDPEDPQSVKKHEELIKYADLFLLDIKHINRDAHKELTGVYNDHTLAFAKWLSEHDKHMWIRHVLVPGITTDDEELHELKAFLDTLKTVDKVEVLPYHTMGIVKYEKLGIPYRLKGVEPPTKEQVLHAREILKVVK